MTILTATVKCNIDAKLVNSVDVGSATYAFSNIASQAFSNGTGAGQANQVWSDTRAIPAFDDPDPGVDDLDFAGGLTNVFGTTLTFTSIKALFIKADENNAGNIVIGDEGTNPFASMFGSTDSTIVLPPGAWVCFMNPNANGYAVTPTTGDILRFSNSNGSICNYTIIAIGEV